MQEIENNSKDSSDEFGKDIYREKERKKREMNIRKRTYLFLIVLFSIEIFLLVNSRETINESVVKDLGSSLRPMLVNSARRKLAKARLEIKKGGVEILSLRSELKKKHVNILDEFINVNEIKNSFSEQVVDYNDPLLNNRVIIIAGYLDENVSIITAKKIMYLEKLNDKNIDLYLYTPGGLDSAALLLIDLMEKSRCKINTYALSKCFSTGTKILAAGTGKRFAYENAIISLTFSKKSYYSKDFRKIHKKRVESFWRKHATFPEKILALMNTENKGYFTAFKAKELGIIDEVIKRK